MFTTISENGTEHQIEEKLSYIAMDFEEEMAITSSSFKKRYELSVDQLVTSGSENQCY